MLRTVTAGAEELPAGFDVPRHRHLEPYAIVVLRGRFAQTSYAGRVRVAEGDLLLQPALDCHANRLLSRGARILRLPWPDVADLGGVHALPDPDAVARAAEQDVRAAVEAARAQRTAPIAAHHADWPDELAAALVADEITALAQWAERRGLARETVSRGFTAAYGVTARQFRLELRTRAAWLRITQTRDPLARIAATTGFSDQAHMSRCIRALTGKPPTHWRGSGYTCSTYRRPTP